MARRIVDTLTNAVLLLMVILGGCGIMNELGNIQWGAVVVALVGAAGILFKSRRYE